MKVVHNSNTVDTQPRPRLTPSNWYKILKESTIRGYKDIWEFIYQFRGG